MVGPHLRRAVALLACSVVVLSGCTKKEASAPPAPSVPPATSATPSAAATPTPTPTPTPKPVNTDPLTGGKKVDGKVFAVKIDNVAAARPQVGLYRADIVFVEEVEASLTRMAAIFHTDFPKRVGPVRSARNTDAELLPMFGKPGLIYSGANRKVKRNIHSSSLYPYLREERDYSRIAPHNVIVNMEGIAKNREAGKAKPIGWTFAAKDARWDKAAKAADPKVSVGSDTFGFAYGGGRYAVSWNGRANVDGDAGKKVEADNVIVLSVKNRPDTNSTSKISVVSETTGSGKVVIYRDGKQLSGTWKRDAISAPMRFLDSAGKDLPLKPGKSWVLLQG